MSGEHHSPAAAAAAFSIGYTTRAGEDVPPVPSAPSLEAVREGGATDGAAPRSHASLPLSWKETPPVLHLPSQPAAAQGNSDDNSHNRSEASSASHAQERGRGRVVLLEGRDNLDANLQLASQQQQQQAQPLGEREREAEVAAGPGSGSHPPNGHADDSNRHRIVGATTDDAICARDAQCARVDGSTEGRAHVGAVTGVRTSPPSVRPSSTVDATAFLSSSPPSVRLGGSGSGKWTTARSITTVPTLATSGATPTSNGGVEGRQLVRAASAGERNLSATAAAAGRGSGSGVVSAAAQLPCLSLLSAGDTSASDLVDGSCSGRSRTTTASTPSAATGSSGSARSATAFPSAVWPLPYFCFPGVPPTTSLVAAATVEQPEVASMGLYDVEDSSEAALSLMSPRGGWQESTPMPVESLGNPNPNRTAANYRVNSLSFPRTGAGSSTDTTGRYSSLAKAWSSPERDSMISQTCGSEADGLVSSPSPPHPSQLTNLNAAAFWAFAAQTPYHHGLRRSPSSISGSASFATLTARSAHHPHSPPHQRRFANGTNTQQHHHATAPAASLPPAQKDGNVSAHSSSVGGRLPPHTPSCSSVATSATRPGSTSVAPLTRATAAVMDTAALLYAAEGGDGDGEEELQAVNGGSSGSREHADSAGHEDDPRVVAERVAMMRRLLQQNFFKYQFWKKDGGVATRRAVEEAAAEDLDDVDGAESSLVGGRPPRGRHDKDADTSWSVPVYGSFVVAATHPAGVVAMCDEEAAEEEERRGGGGRPPLAATAEAGDVDDSADFRPLSTAFERRASSLAHAHAHGASGGDGGGDSDDNDGARYLWARHRFPRARESGPSTAAALSCFCSTASDAYQSTHRPSLSLRSTDLSLFSVRKMMCETVDNAEVSATPGEDTDEDRTSRGLAASASLQGLHLLGDAAAPPASSTPTSIPKPTPAPVYDCAPHPQRLSEVESTVGAVIAQTLVENFLAYAPRAATSGLHAQLPLAMPPHFMSRLVCGHLTACRSSFIGEEGRADSSTTLPSSPAATPTGRLPPHGRAASSDTPASAEDVALDTYVVARAARDEAGAAPAEARGPLSASAPLLETLSQQQHQHQQRLASLVSSALPLTHGRASPSPSQTLHAASTHPPPSSSGVHNGLSSLVWGPPRRRRDSFPADTACHLTPLSTTTGTPSSSPPPPPPPRSLVAQLLQAVFAAEQHRRETEEQPPQGDCLSASVSSASVTMGEHPSSIAWRCVGTEVAMSLVAHSGGGGATTALGKVVDLLADSGSGAALSPGYDERAAVEEAAAVTCHTIHSAAEGMRVLSDGLARLTQAQLPLLVPHKHSSNGEHKDRGAAAMSTGGTPSGDESAHAMRPPVCDVTLTLQRFAVFAEDTPMPLILSSLSTAGGRRADARGVQRDRPRRSRSPPAGSETAAALEGRLRRRVLCGHLTATDLACAALPPMHEATSLRWSSAEGEEAAWRAARQEATLRGVRTAVDAALREGGGSGRVVVLVEVDAPASADEDGLPALPAGFPPVTPCVAPSSASLSAGDVRPPEAPPQRNGIAPDSNPPTEEATKASAAAGAAAGGHRSRPLVLDVQDLLAVDRAPLLPSSQPTGLPSNPPSAQTSIAAHNNNGDDEDDEDDSSAGLRCSRRHVRRGAGDRNGTPSGTPLSQPAPLAAAVLNTEPPPPRKPQRGARP